MILKETNLKVTVLVKEIRAEYLHCTLHKFKYITKWVKVALRPSNAKRLYTDEKSTETGEVT